VDENSMFFFDRINKIVQNSWGEKGSTWCGQERQKAENGDRLNKNKSCKRLYA